mmetsp:Transcript_26902/g.37136  ORF Transcript_26902/g.37136 Transcript_26902/m.37136 type:complete len:313 (+) Transcript_26902:1488-2426(+)
MKGLPVTAIACCSATMLPDASVEADPGLERVLRLGRMGLSEGGGGGGGRGPPARWGTNALSGRPERDRWGRETCPGVKSSGGGGNGGVKLLEKLAVLPAGVTLRLLLLGLMRTPLGAAGGGGTKVVMELTCERMTERRCGRPTGGPMEGRGGVKVERGLSSGSASLGDSGRGMFGGMPSAFLPILKAFTIEIVPLALSHLLDASSFDSSNCLRVLGFEIFRLGVGRDTDFLKRILKANLDGASTMADTTPMTIFIAMLDASMPKNTAEIAIWPRIMDSRTVRRCGRVKSSPGLTSKMEITLCSSLNASDSSS